MDLTQNEKKVIVSLIDDARSTDASTARKLRITLQAVRKIRKKLEEQGIIKGYSVQLDYSKLGIRTFSMVMFKVKPQAWYELKENEINQILFTVNALKIWRIPRANITHIVIYAFNTSREMDSFFFSLQTKQSRYIEVKGVYSFSNESYIDPGEHMFVKQKMAKKKFKEKKSNCDEFT